MLQDHQILGLLYDLEVKDDLPANPKFCVLYFSKMNLIEMVKPVHYILVKLDIHDMVILSFGKVVFESFSKASLINILENDR